MKRAIKEISVQVFATREALVFWTSTYIILVLMYRSAPYWSSLSLNYTYSTFLFLLLPLVVASFPQKKNSVNIVFWAIAFTFVILPLLAGEFLPEIRNRYFPPYNPETGPLNSIEKGIILVVPSFLLVLLYCRFSGFDPKSLGLGIGKWKFWIPLTVVLVLVMTPILFIFSKKPDFIQTYPLFKSMIKSDADFWSVDLTWFYYLYIWEFFFRGFILFSLAKKMGPARAIFVQAIIFSFAHLGKPEIEVYSSMVGGVLVGILSYISNSVLPGAIIHWLIALIMDFFVFFSA
ncbi:CPBP family intramembrane metalloprotease [candidate division WOR-3 bacterium]|nr:CPBP family intramembrane metalloprotease [candidate division WOR-3 bacterium]